MYVCTHEVLLLSSTKMAPHVTGFWSYFIMFLKCADANTDVSADVNADAGH